MCTNNNDLEYYYINTLDKIDKKHFGGQIIEVRTAATMELKRPNQMSNILIH